MNGNKLKQAASDITDLADLICDQWPVDDNGKSQCPISHDTAVIAAATYLANRDSDGEVQVNALTYAQGQV
ncbi:MAG: hypothetical protein ACR2PR_09305 [Pseudohongiellaceae bacterium]